MADIWDEIAKPLLLDSGFIGGMGGGLVFWILKNRIEKKQREQLESFKSDLQISADQMMKIREQELRFVTEVWELLSRFIMEFLDATNPEPLFTGMDLDALSNQQYVAFVKETRLLGVDKEMLAEIKTNREQAYLDAVYRSRKNDLLVRYRRFKWEFKAKRVLFTEELAEVTQKIDKLCFDYQDGYQRDRFHDMSSREKAFYQFPVDLEPLTNRFLELARERLLFESKGIRGVNFENRSG